LLAAECGVRPAQTRVIMWGRSKDKTNQSYAPSIPLTSSSSTPDNGNRNGRACKAVRVVVLRLQRACVRGCRARASVGEWEWEYGILVTQEMSVRDSMHTGVIVVEGSTALGRWKKV
jgi:hypothetical protein